MQSVTCWRSLSLAALIAMVSLVGVCEGCTCAPAHPQQQFCNSDFVIRAKVKKEFMQDDFTRVYKVRIGKEYKMSEKARVALKAGRILTFAEESTCGTRLEPGKVYVLMGNVASLKARISLCNFAKVWQHVSKRQRRGLQRMYQAGCTSCKIDNCWRRSSIDKCPKRDTHCNWITFSHNDTMDCERMHGICLPSSSGKCTWMKTKLQAACKKNHPKFTNIKSKHRRVDNFHHTQKQQYSQTRSNNVTALFTQPQQRPLFASEKQHLQSHYYTYQHRENEKQKQQQQHPYHRQLTISRWSG